MLRDEEHELTPSKAQASLMDAGFGVALGRGLREASGDSTVLPRYAQCGGSGGNCAQYSSCDNTQFNDYACAADDVRNHRLWLIAFSWFPALFRVDLQLRHDQCLLTKLLCCEGNGIRYT